MEAQRHVDTYLELLDRDDVDAVSVKLSSAYSQIDLLAFDHVVERVTERLRPVFAKASSKAKLVYFDMEAFRDLELTVAAFERLVLEPDLLGANAGIALQAYLPDTMAAADRLATVAHERVVEASLHRWAVPIFPSKSLMDANFKRLLERLLRASNDRTLRIGVGSHNLFDQCYALLLAEHRRVTQMHRVEMLAGMAGSFARVFASLCGGILLYAPAALPEHFPVLHEGGIVGLHCHASRQEIVSPRILVQSAYKVRDQYRTSFQALSGIRDRSAAPLACLCSRTNSSRTTASRASWYRRSRAYTSGLRGIRRVS